MSKRVVAEFLHRRYEITLSDVFWVEITGFMEVPRCCPVCHSDRFFYGQIHAPLRGPGLGGKTFLKIEAPAYLQTAVCLSCGSVQICLADDDLEVVRAWKAEEE